MTTRERLERIKLGYPRIPGNEEQMASALLAVLDWAEPKTLYSPVARNVVRLIDEHMSERGK